MTSTPTALVVGGGVSGLVAARDLARAGWDVTVWEAAAQWGGAVAPLTLSGITTDAGAEAVAISRPDGLALIEELGLGNRLVHPRRTDARLLLPDGAVELPSGVLGIPADLEDPRLALALDAAAIKQVRAEGSMPVADIPSDATVGQVVRERLGDEVFTRLVDPVVAGVHAVSGDEADLTTLLPGMAELMHQRGGLIAAAAHLRGSLGPSGSAVASLHGGMSTLTTALVADCRSRGVHLDIQTGATELERDLDRWVVTNTRGDTCTVDAVVLAIPPRECARLLHSHDTGLAGDLARIETTPVKVVTLVIDSEELDEQPVGPGILVSPERDDVEAKAMTHSSAKWQWWDDVLPAHRHVVRLSYGKAGTAPPSDEYLRQRAPLDARTLLGVQEPLKVVDTAVTLWPDSLVRPTPGHAARMAMMRARINEQRDLCVLGSALAGNGLAGVIRLARAEAARLTEQFTEAGVHIKEMST